MALLTRETALDASTFHHPHDCAQVVTIGPRGGYTYPRTESWRRNGRTQTWRTRPTEFRLPVKHGMYAYWSLTHDHAAPAAGSTAWHTGTAEGCDLGALSASIAALRYSALDTADVR